MVGQATSIRSTTSRSCTNWTARRFRKDQGTRRLENEGRVVGPKWTSKQYGQSGQWVSELFPHLSEHVDDIAFLKSMTGRFADPRLGHVADELGPILSGSPALGSWVNYGLGTVNENLPGFVVMLDPSGGPISGRRTGPADTCPPLIRERSCDSKGPPISTLSLPEGMTQGVERELLDSLHATNSEHLAWHADNSNLAARIASYELAYKMQQYCARRDRSGPRDATDARHVWRNQERTRHFGRRLFSGGDWSRRGVRFIQLYSGGSHNDANWDAHGIWRRTTTSTRAIPINRSPALLTDLKQRGLLDETLDRLGRRIRSPANRRIR